MQPSTPRACTSASTSALGGRWLRESEEQLDAVALGWEGKQRTAAHAIPVIRVSDTPLTELKFDEQLNLGAAAARSRACSKGLAWPPSSERPRLAASHTFA